MFDIPIVLFIFKRLKATVIIDQIAKIRPEKLYIVADGPRNQKESEEVANCRSAVEKHITWSCTVVKNYADVNRGVYKNIGEGAKWVFQNEDRAIFLEDDNMPEITFFYYCKELLQKYECNEQVLWICGTNYLEKYETKNNYDYLFTKHMLPCGWASWSKKFTKYYDGCLLGVNRYCVKDFKKQYYPKVLYYTMRDCWLSEYCRISNGKAPISWDNQMDFSIKFNDLYGICPTKNQICNIGVDNYSIHGGNSKKLVMTDRFCERKTFPLTFPLKGPETICVDNKFEKKIGKVILPPLKTRFKQFLLKCFRKIFHIPYDISTKEYLKNVFRYKRK